MKPRRLASNLCKSRSNPNRSLSLLFLSCDLSPKPFSDGKTSSLVDWFCVRLNRRPIYNIYKWDDNADLDEQKSGSASLSRRLRRFLEIHQADEPFLEVRELRRQWPEVGGRGQRMCGGAG